MGGVNMNIQLTQKETMFLKDLKSQEEMCIKKYNAYSNQAKDPQLKQLFNELEKQEQQHLDSINQLLNGQVPNINQSQGQSQSQSQGQSQQMISAQGQGQGLQMSSGQQGMQSATKNSVTFNNNASDADLCHDLLSTEKYVSRNYDTAIFEFTNTQARELLNHIQKEEQQHGERIFKYMQQNGMYEAQ